MPLGSDDCDHEIVKGMVTDAASAGVSREGAVGAAPALPPVASATNAARTASAETWKLPDLRRKDSMEWAPSLSGGNRLDPSSDRSAFRASVGLVVPTNASLDRFVEQIQTS